MAGYTAGACWGGPKLRLPSTKGVFTKRVGRLALYVFCLAAHRRAITCGSGSFPDDDHRSVLVGPVSPLSFFAPPTSRCTSCHCRSGLMEPGEALTSRLRHIVPGVSSVQTDETSVLLSEAPKALPGENRIQTGEDLAPLPTHDAAGKNIQVSTARTETLQHNLKELQQLLEDEQLRTAAQELLREEKPPSSASAQAPVLTTLEDWQKFDFTANPNGISKRPAGEVGDSSAAAVLSRELLLHYGRLANLNFLTLSLETPAETPEAPRLEGGASRTRLVRKLVRLARDILGFSESIPGSENLQRASRDSTPHPTAVATEGSLSLSSNMKHGYADAESGGPRADTKSSSMEYKAIDIRGLTGTANPFLFLRFLLLGIALTGFERYFDENFRGQPLAFFGPDTLLSSLSLHRTPQLFDAMTRTRRTPKKKGSFVSRFFRRSSGSIPPVQTWSTLDTSGIAEGSHRLLLYILQRHLEITLTYAQQQLDALKAATVPVETSLSFVENLHRLHTFACLPDATNKFQIPCAFENTSLHKSTRDPSALMATDNDAAREEIHQQDLKTAFLTITGLELNIWIARLLSDPQLGVAANKWFMYDTETFPKLLARFNAHARKTLATYGLENLLTPQKRNIKQLAPDAQLVEETLRRKNDGRTALRACLYAFMLIPRSSPYRKEGRSPLDFVKAIFGEEPAPMLASTKVNPVSLDDLVDHGEPFGYTYMWLFEFLSQTDSASALAKKRTAVRRSRTWIRIVHSHRSQLLRRLYTKWTVGFSGRKRQTRLQQARNLLLRRLPPDWPETVIQVFRFTAHTAALQQVTTFSSLFRIKSAPDLEGKTHLQNESVVKRCEGQIYRWSRYGFSSAALEADEQNRSFKEKWDSVKLENMPTPDMTEWWRRVHHIILEDLEKYLQQENYLEGLGDNIYTLVADTVKRMREGTSPDSTFFLARAGTITRQTQLARIAGKVKKTVGKLFREVPPSKHVVWLGVNFDGSGIMTLLTRLRDIAQSTADVGTALLLDEAFMKLVAETVRMKTTGVLRQPLSSLRNVSVLSIRPDYANLSSLQRATEFDSSLCAEHCVGLWQVLLAFVYPALLNPSMLSHYEKAYSRAGAKKMLSSPDYVNSLRYVLASDAVLDFWEYTTPRQIKESLKGMDEGQSLMYANLMRLAGHFYDGFLSLHHLGHTLQLQAPFMGQTAKDWIRKRRAARKKAIFSALTLGLMFLYTVVSSLEIFTVMKDVGMRPIQECSWNAIMQEMACVPAAIGAQSVTGPLFAALTDVFHIGIFSGVGSAMMGALGVGSVYMIVRSESRKVMRMEMVLSQVVVKLWRHVVKFASKALTFVRKRKTIISTMMARATAIYNRKAQASLAPRVHETGLQLVDSVLQEQPQIGAPD